MNTLHLLILIAATWRLASLVANEEGPYMLFHRLRKWAKRSTRRWVRRSRFATLLECEWCNSIWFGAVLALGYGLLGENFIWLILPLALSSGTIVLKLVVHVLKGVDTRLDKMNTPPFQAGDSYPSLYKIKLFEEQKEKIFRKEVEL